MFEYQLDYSTMKATPTRKKKKRNENQAPNVSFQSSTGIVKRKTPRKKKMLKESKSQRKKKAKKSNNAQTLTPPATTTTATATATATATRPATKTTTQKDDHVDVHYYSSSVANSYHQNQHSVTVSNGEVVLDIPQDFTFSHSEDDDENDDDDDDDDDEEEHPSSRHQRKRSSWRRSNALNEDRYDFCLVVDTVKGTEKNESNNKNSKNNDTPNDAATRNAPSCCACLCFKTKGKNQGTKDDDDGTTAIASINGEEDDDDTTQQQQQQTILDMSPTPPTTTHDDYDPATAYNHAPMQQLQLQRRRARRHGALKKEDDDKAKVSSSTSSSTSSTSPSATTTATTFATPDESIRVDHTGIGLSGQRMVSLIRSKLRHAGLLVKRVQNLTGTRTLLKVRASQSRLEQEAERMRLVMRTKDGGYARFKQSDRHAFCGAGYYSDSNDHVLFRSSDRQSILLHIIKSSRDVGGAQLSPHVDPCGDAIVMMFPVHMVLRILELKRSWSTAFFCCRTPPTSRYGSVQRGKQYQQSDAGKLLSSMKFRFEEGGDGTEENEENQENEREAQVGDCRNPCKSKHCCTWATVYDLFTFGWLVRQPLDAISEYYGETIGFYFAFLEFYTIWLAMPTAAGIVLFCFQVYEQRIDHWLLPFYSLFVGLWSMFFLVRWRRRRIELAYRWGVMDHEEEEIERIEFKGTTRTSTVTGAEERYYSPTKRTLKQIFITIPVTIVWLVAIVWLYLYLFDTRDSIMDKFQSQQQNASATMQNDTVSALPSTNVGDASNRRMSSSFLNFQTSKTPGTSMSLSLSDRHVYGSDIQFWLYLLIPPILCGGLIPLLNVLYLKLATKLNDFENHKTESSYQFNLIAKVLSFRMINCFCSLYYYAFSGRHPILRLTVQLASFMVVGQLQKHFKEVLWPCVKNKIKTWCAKRAVRKAEKKRERWQQENVTPTTESVPNGGKKDTATDKKESQQPLSERRLRQAEEEAWTEARMPIYNTFNDYAEMMVQYGYVTFFSMAFPLAPGLALLNNVVEIRSDAFKLCNNTRRPVARKAAGIGVWFRTLQLMSVLAVVTNLAHIGFSSDQFSRYFPNVTHAEKVVIIFGFEHCVLMVQWVVMTFVPDAPFWVRNSIRREKHLSKERLHNQFAMELQQEKKN